MTTAGSSQSGIAPQGYIRLHHGTDLASANDIMNNGLDQARAAAFNASGEFWATTDLATANTFAQVNPANGAPARFDFNLPPQVLAAFLGASPPRAYQHGSDVYEFLPAAFPMLNQHIANCQVVSPVP